MSYRINRIIDNYGYDEEVAYFLLKSLNEFIKRNYTFTISTTIIKSTLIKNIDIFLRKVILQNILLLLKSAYFIN